MATTGAIKRKWDATGERVPLASCICGTDYAKPREAVAKLERAPHGAVCRTCRQTIERGEEALRCGNFQEYCAAWWHPACHEPGTPCQGCGDTIWKAISRRSTTRQA